MITIRGDVVIATERCKGCELCIPACPPGVLTMSQKTNAMGFQYPELHPGCTGCDACHEVCPDFVFEVFKFDTPVVVNEEGPGPERPGAGGAQSGEAGPERPGAGGAQSGEAASP